MTVPGPVAGLVIGDPSDPDAHPLHLEWLQSVGADLSALDAEVLPGVLGDAVANDVVAGLRGRIHPRRPIEDAATLVVEAPAALYALPRLDLEETDVVFLHTSWRIAGTAAYSFDSLPRTLRPLGALDRRVDAAALAGLIDQYTDGVVTISRQFETQLRNAGVGVPTTVHYPSPSVKLVDRLNSVTPNYGASKAAVVCTWREHKGVDLLVDGWERVREIHPDACLRLVGADHPPRYADRPGVEISGFVDDLSTVFARAGVYVHPARVDGFAVSVVEAMTAGLPTILTETTGAAECVDGKMPSWTVVDPEPEALANAVVRYFNLPVSRRQNLGQNARTIGRQLARPNDRSFADALSDLLGS